MIACGYFYLAHCRLWKKLSDIAIWLLLFFLFNWFAKVGITMERSSSLQSILTSLLESRMHFLAVLTFSKFMIENTQLFLTSNCIFFHVAWSPPMDGLWHRRKYACPWVIVSFLKNNLDSCFISISNNWFHFNLGPVLFQFIQKVGTLCGLYRGTRTSV